LPIRHAAEHPLGGIRFCPLASWRFTVAKNVTLTADTDHIGTGAADPPEAPIDH
jgi:hypothetical protein